MCVYNLSNYRNNPMKRIVIYHRKSEKFECPDGTAAAAVVSLCYPDAVLYGGMYGQEPPDVSAYRKIVIVDFSYPDRKGVV